jgi:sugar phosphate isomerase/epimerase
MNRRDAFLAAGAAAGSVLVAGSAAANAEKSRQPGRFRYCLNMSTIRGQNRSADEEIDIAARAGYDAIEPWLRKLHEYAASGGSLKDLRKRIEDNGLTVESAIGFAPWIVDDDAQRAQGLEEAKRDMAVIAQLGGKRIAAPPAGVPRGQHVSLTDAAVRYRKLLEIGQEIGVTPQVEMWGANPSIGSVGAAVFVAIESGHPQACFLGDVYHAYKGGSNFEGLKLLSPQALQVFHFNDYPADPPRETIGDEHRVYPGDGIAPLKEILQTFQGVGATPVLSLELFNREYWKQDPLEVARSGLQKMKDAVAKAT